MLFAVVSGAACGGNEQKPQAAPTEASVDQLDIGKAPRLELELGEAMVTTALGDLPIDDQVRNDALQVANRWAQSALVDAFVGGTSADLGSFSEGAAAEAAADRAVTTNEGLPQLAGPATIKTARASMIGLGTPESPTVLTVTIALSVEGEVESGTITSTHLGDLTLMNQQGWKIVGYDLSVNRSGPGMETPATGGSAATDGGEEK